MIGRAPMPPNFAPPPMPMPPAAVMPAPPMPTPVPQARRPEAPAPVIRLQSEDEPAPLARRPTPLVMPTPEQLGVTASPVSRFERLGANCFHMEKLADGGCLVTCLVPAPKVGVAHHFEARAANAEEATRMVLDEAEAWAARK